MKVTFFSNYMVIHQLPFSLEMVKFQVDFKFVACEPIEQERLDMHYKDLNSQYDYIVRSYEDEKQDKIAEQLAIESDVVIFGSGNIKYLQKRLSETNKLTFFCTERIFKKGIYRRFIPITYNKIKRNFLQYKNKNFYVLCNSAYTSYDLSLCGFPKEKCFKFGYFPETLKYNLSELVKNKKQGEIVWVGRFIDWKHPEVPVLLAEKLKKAGVEFHITMIGNGVEMPRIKSLIEKGVFDNITLLGSVPSDEVRKKMEEFQIFISTSDFQEGWGAVLNEGMNSGCACVASHAIGAAPYLIEDGQNGLLYKNGNIDDLFTKIELLLETPELCSKLSNNAYETITTVWNAEMASKRLLEVINELLNNNFQEKFEKNLLSRADIMPNNWYKQI